MDRFEAMQLFVRIVTRRSFTLAAQDLQIPRSTATKTIAALERRLGVRLLQRTTRVVRPTLDGEAYYQRCLQILAALDDADNAFHAAPVQGLVRLDVQGTLARHFLFPHLPALLARYPQLELSISESDRWVNLAQEGVDCVLRYGPLPDSELVAQQVTLLPRLTCAAPAYVARFGTPACLEDLDTHHMVALRALSSGQITPMSFQTDAGLHTLSLPSPVVVTGTESYLAAIRLGLGLAQVPYFHAQADLQSGRLLALLTTLPPPSMPVSLLLPRSRQLSARVRAVRDWIVSCFASDGVAP